MSGLLDLGEVVLPLRLYNIPRIEPKDITEYWQDGSLGDRIAGRNGFDIYEGIQVGDYIDMGRPVTCPNSTNGTLGTQYVRVESCGGYMKNYFIDYPHLVMGPGKGMTAMHFGKHRMGESATGAYYNSEMHQSVLGPVTTSGSIASGATINQQLYYTFGSLLKTHKALLSNAINANAYNRYGTATGASSSWDWYDVQSCLFGEVEIFGATIWSSSGFDTGEANHQLEIYQHCKEAAIDTSAWYFLKDVTAASYFAYVSYCGHADNSGASGADGAVRPKFILAA